ncbi:hypothetical protein ACFSUK_18535 [Sphingobium scionense]|uniref:DUF5983 domain-containing protein n=2 Tax=Sphingobium TaxID=165695 RepID=T0IN56_9SPHN|nr:MULTISPECIES: hypothetical protein [Sphingobium]EQB11084.1 hypothetical protein RLDS_24640 [Sphingobium lactosutens DS20]MBB4151171.1 hypothetical protein [Sphingobium scionense]
MTSHASFRLEIAACLWETVLNFRDRPPTDPDALQRALAIHRAFDRIGADSLRPIVLSWTPKIERAWQDVDDDCPFGCDWAYIGRWMVENVDWTHPHHPVLHSDMTGQDAEQAPPTGIGEAASSAPTDTASCQDHLALLARARSAIEYPDDLANHARTQLIAEIRGAEDRIERSPLPWPVHLHAAAIEHRYGTNIHAAIDAATLDAEIAAWCRDWWKETGDERDPATLDDETVIAVYFDGHPSDGCAKDQLQVVPPGLKATSTSEPVEMGRYCVLSTAHLTVQTAGLLDGWASWPPTERPIDIAASVYGWFVPTRSLEEARQAQLPADLLRLMAFGRSRGFQFLLLDCDGDRSDDLPVHDW